MPVLPRAFALDMLEFVLAHHAVVFTSLPNFERLLGGRLASLLMTSLRSERVVEDEVRPPACLLAPNLDTEPGLHHGLG